MAEDKPMPRHRKMYKGSPRIEADEEGKKVVKKGPTEAEKKSAEVNSGTDGMPMHEKAMMDMHQKHSTERMALFHKHEQEQLKVHHEMMKSAPKEETGGEEVNKVEKDVKE